MAEESFKLTFLGDLMLGRLIDQCLPNHVEEPEDAAHVKHFRQSYTHLRDYDTASPWGNTLDFLRRSDLVLGNLETAATTHTTKWPDKVFNYRMHPANIDCLKQAKLAYVSLANNHTLDFDRQGLFATVRTVEEAGIAFAGAGRAVDEARRPAILQLYSHRDTNATPHIIHLYSFADHPRDWASVLEFNLIKYNAETRAMLKQVLHQTPTAPALKIVSLHWGPNYSWQPDPDLRSLARFLIEECDVDIIHGHSSHHVQGVQVINGKLVIYGCGDFIDDYAVNNEYRNDLSAAWNVTVKCSAEGKLSIEKLEIYPNRIYKFQAGLLPAGDDDHTFVCDKVRALSGQFGTIIEPDLGSEGQLIIDIERNLKV